MEPALDAIKFGTPRYIPYSAKVIEAKLLDNI